MPIGNAAVFVVATRDDVVTLTSQIQAAQFLTHATFGPTKAAVDTLAASISGAPTALPGLYFCGQFVSPSGMLREIGIEAKRIAKSVANA